MLAGTFRGFMQHLDGRQAENESRMIEITCKITIVHIIILIDSGSSHSYITHNLIEKCLLNKSNIEVAIMV